MLVLLSPAKSFQLSLQIPRGVPTSTKPIFPSQTQSLISFLQTKSTKDIKSMMSLSDTLAELNVERYQNFNTALTYPAGLVFDGPAFRGLELSSFSSSQATTAQTHLRILSGLYGILKPYDEIKPYRLEMGTKINMETTKTLYSFWGDSITTAINQELEQNTSVFPCKCIVNLCSAEYWKVIQMKSFASDVQVIECIFRDNGRVVSVYAKRARGLMSRFLLNRVDAAVAAGQFIDTHVLHEILRDFNVEGYVFDAKNSTTASFEFSRTGTFAKPIEEEDVLPVAKKQKK